jgi:hypothetical protein
VDLRTGTAVTEAVPGGVRLADGDVVEAETVLTPSAPNSTPSGWPVTRHWRGG